MFQFKGKTIFIISPEYWGEMRVSKHHYAIELVKLGNKVYFFEPADLKHSINGAITTTSEGVHVFKYKPLARGENYIGKRLFSLLQKIQLKSLLRKLDKPDVVWCFDFGRYDDLNIFGATTKIFHPVDHNIDRSRPDCSLTADFIFSTSYKILDYMKPPNKLGQVINHGLNSYFEEEAIERRKKINFEEEIRSCETIGFWGNLFKECLDRKKILSLIDAFPHLKFKFWGPFEFHQNNLGGKPAQDVYEFIETLKQKPNVILKGPRRAKELINEIKDVDLLINIEFESSIMWDNGNPHKVLEYMATGLPIFTTPMIMYTGYDFFFYQNGDVIDDMQKLIINWTDWSSKEKQLQRIDFALDNTYKKQIHRIGNFISEHM